LLRFGIVSKIHPSKPYARIRFDEDDSTSYWLCVLQIKTLKDKFYVMPDIGEQVACLMDNNSEEGVILGAVYSDRDKPREHSNKIIYLQLENGSFIDISKEENKLTVSFPNIYLIGNIVHDGLFQNSKGIICEENIFDKKSSMQAIRDTYNIHTHIGNEGAPTSKPNNEMQ